MTEPTPHDVPLSLIEVAEHFLSVHDDLLDPEDDLGDEINDRDALEIIRRNYVSGTCQAFAVALHDHLGLPLVALMGGLHVAVQCPDGQIMDFMGTAPLKQVAQRYGWKQPTVERWTLDRVLDALGDDDDSLNGPWGDLTVARWVRAHLDRWEIPSTELNPQAPRTTSSKVRHRR